MLPRTRDWPPMVVHLEKDRRTSFGVDVSVSDNPICFVGPAGQRLLMLYDILYSQISTPLLSKLFE
jgi:hypothetical protein